MRSSLSRHLELLTVSAAEARGSQRMLVAPAPGVVSDSEFVPRDYVSFLLHIDAEIEHGLMVQYLYAAYSLGGPQVPPERRDQVRGWQEVILGIAKEEMGHLLSIQNVLRSIGAPLNLGREDFPWDVPYYPFPFSLEPLTLDSLAKYVYAESPKDWSGPLAQEIYERVIRGGIPSPHRVGDLFDQLIPLIEDPRYLEDSVFQSDSFPYQASWDDWGRGYRDGARGNITQANPKGAPNVLLAPVLSRYDAVKALRSIAEQGEAPSSVTADEASHFVRFLKIYEELKVYAGSGWSPAKPVATNPYISLDETLDLAEGLSQPVRTSPITDPQTRLWAALHNLRYRMLLLCLAHTFTLPGSPLDSATRTPRGVVINATFGEMYNLRALADLLMQLPLGDPKQPDLRAGPPFQMPYTLDSPLGERNRWRLHEELLEAALGLVERVLPHAPAVLHRFLLTMQDTDRRMRASVQRVLEDRSLLLL
jgi:hypothetical protein